MKLNIPARLKMYRDEFRLSQAALAERLGVSSMTISRIESGQTTKISSDLLERILDILCIDLADELKDRADKIIDRERRIKAEEKAQKEAAEKEQEQKNIQLARVILDQHLKQFGYEPYEEKTPLNPAYWRVYSNPDLGKIWMVYFCLFEPDPYPLDLPVALNNALGNILVNGHETDCLSVLFHTRQLYKLDDNLLRLKIRRLNFDVRLLVVDLEKERMHCQIENSVHYDGYGLFDFQDPELSEEERNKALMSYGSFVASFNQ